MGVRKILQKNFAKKIFLQKMFFLVWTCIKPNLLQNFFPLLGGESLWNFFFQSEHVSSQIWCQKIFPLGGEVSLWKIFFPVWTCIKPNLVSKIFLFTGGGGCVPLWKFFFPVCTCIKLDSMTKNLPFYTMCLSSLFKELWPFKNRKIYRNVLKIHF